MLNAVFSIIPKITCQNIDLDVNNEIHQSDIRSLITKLFIEQLVQVNKKENIQAQHQCPFVRGIHWIHTQRASNAGSIFMLWCYHEALLPRDKLELCFAWKLD